MTPYLKSVINELYRSEHTRKVFALSRADAEQLPALAHVAVISITAPERPLADVGGFEHLLRLSFEDVDHLNTELSLRAKAKVSRAFTTDQANQVLSFVNELPSHVSAIVAHCEGGFSRSCAVAYMLNEIYGYKVQFDRLQKANPSVIKIIRKAVKALPAGE